MNLEKYHLRAGSQLQVFEFTSEGPKGKIHKIVQFSPTNYKDLYNLGFGDKNLQTGEIHLPALLPFVSNNDIVGGNENSDLFEFLQELSLKNEGISRSVEDPTKALL